MGGMAGQRYTTLLGAGDKQSKDREIRVDGQAFASRPHPEIAELPLP